MKIIVAGSSGSVGSLLVPYLKHQGYDVWRLVREGKSQFHDIREVIYWDPENYKLDPKILENSDVIINLSGDNIFRGRWTPKKKEKIRSSRVGTTRFLCTQLASLKNPPRLLINASAVGIYGTRGDAFLSESSAPGEGFLADVVKEWEQATEPAQAAGIRVICLRLGVVLSKSGGALQKMLTPFKLGLGGVLGSGLQYMSWITIDDLLRLIVFLIDHPEIKGPVNATAPHPVSNREFTEALGRVLHRPTFFPLSEFILSLLFGEMAKDVLLSSARVEPLAAVGAGFTFQHPRIEEALRKLLH